MPTPDATALSPASTAIPSTPTCAPCSSSSSGPGNNSLGHSSTFTLHGQQGGSVSGLVDRSNHAMTPPIASYNHSLLHQSPPYQQPVSLQHLQLQQQQQPQPQHPLSSPLFGPSSSASSVGNVPDPVVMEFISKIGQIVIKARTQTPSHLAPLNLDSVLQDRDLWRNNSSVYLNIFHPDQFALLERWVISFTPPLGPPVAMEALPRQGVRSGFSSPLGHSASASPASSSMSVSPGLLANDSGVAATPSSSIPPSSSSRKVTTDLILLVQSLYTQIRALPLNNCLTSLDETTRIPKDQLDYTVTSGQEDLTQSCQASSLRHGTQAELQDYDMNGNPIDTEQPLSKQARSRPPLEFLADASLKLVQFEASHKRWGRVRVTGIYDESVGGRIPPDRFQDATKVGRSKSQRRSKDPSSSKPLSRKHRLTSTDSSTTPNDQKDSSEVHCAAYQRTETETFPRKLQPTRQPSPPRASSSRQSQRPMSPIPTQDDLVHHQTSSLIRHGLLPALYPSNDTNVAPTHQALQESLHLTIPATTTTTTTTADPTPTSDVKAVMESFQFPPLLSPSLDIPEKGANNTHSTPSQPRTTDPLESQRPSTSVSYNHMPEPTSPVRHTINRRRSSRLSIVMNRNDLSPEPTSPSATPKGSPTSPRSSRAMDVDSPHARPHHRPSSFKASFGPSPTKHSYLRRNSLNPVVTGGDLFGSLVGSYEESILSGRMSTMPSKPLTFTAQIGVLASQEYKDCPAKLRCPRHVQLEFPAVFYDYDSSHHHHHHHHQQQHHHHPSSLSSSISKGLHHPTSHSGWMGSSPASGTSISSLHHGSLSHSQSHAHGWLASSLAHDDPVLPYVGNVDLDNGFRGSKRFAKMPGGMRIPLRGQVQVMIKNPNKTVVKVFLVPYDFTDMPPNTKTFLRQKYYSLDQGIPVLTSYNTSNQGASNGNGNNNSSGGTLRYAVHLQFCCPAEGYVYLYRTIRVVFANRVPDGKEKLKIVLEGLGAGNHKTGSGSCLPTAGAGAEEKVPLEQKYVPMRKGEVLFSGRKKRRALHSEDGQHSLEASPQLQQHLHLRQSASPPPQQQQHHLVHNPHHPLHAQMPGHHHHHHHYHSVHPHAHQHARSPNQSYSSPQTLQGLGLGLGFPSHHVGGGNNGASPLYPAQKWTLGQMGPNGEMQADPTPLSGHYNHTLDAGQSFRSATNTLSSTPTSPRIGSPMALDQHHRRSPAMANVRKDWEYYYQTDSSHQELPTSVLIGTPAKLKTTTAGIHLGSPSAAQKPVPYFQSPVMSSTSSPSVHELQTTCIIPSSSSSSSSSSSMTPSSSLPLSPSSSLDRLKAAVSNVSEEVLRIKSLAHGLKQMGVRSPPSGGSGGGGASSLTSSSPSSSSSSSYSVPSRE